MLSATEEAKTMRRLAITVALASCAVSLVPADTSSAEEPIPTNSNEATLTALRTPASVDFLDAPLNDALSFLANAARVQLYVHWPEMSTIGIRNDDQVNIALSDMAVRDILDTLLHDHVRDLDWYVQHGVLHVTTSDKAESRLVTQVYDVSHLVAQAAKPYRIESWGCCGGWAGEPSTFSVGDPNENAAKDGEQVESRSMIRCETQATDRLVPRPVEFYDFDGLIDPVISTVLSDSWEDMGGDASINPVVVKGKPLLVVSHHRRGHEELSRLLDNLSAFAE